MKRVILVILASLMLVSIAGCNSSGEPMNYDELLRCEKEYCIVDGDWPKSFDEMWGNRVSASLASGVVKRAAHRLGWGQGEYTGSFTEYEIEITSVWDDGSEQRLSPEELIGRTIKAHCYDHVTFAEDKTAIEFISKQIGREVRSAEELEEENGCAELVPVHGTKYKWRFNDYELPMKEGEEYTFFLMMTPGYNEQTGEQYYRCCYVSPKDQPLEERLKELDLLKGFEMKGDEHALEIAEEIRQKVNGTD